MERKGFIFYASFYEAIKELPNENQLKVYQAITNFALTGIEPNDLNGIEKAVFILIKPQIIANNKRYENGCGGGRPKKDKETDKKTKEKTNGFENKKPKQNQDITKQKPKEKDNNIKEKDIKKENKEKIDKKENKEKDTPEQTAVPDSLSETQKELLPEPQTPKLKPKQNTPKTPQAEVYEYFAAKYKQHTGIEYLSKKKDFVNLSKLIEQFGIAQVKQKIDWLEIGCTHPGVFWFAKDINDFTIGTLQTQWNHILPRLTDEQRKEQAKKKKEQEMQRKVCEELAKQGIKIDSTTGKVIAVAR